MEKEIIDSFQDLFREMIDNHKKNISELEEDIEFLESQRREKE